MLDLVPTFYQLFFVFEDEDPLLSKIEIYF